MAYLDLRGKLVPGEMPLCPAMNLKNMIKHSHVNVNCFYSMDGLPRDECIACDIVGEPRDGGPIEGILSSIAVLRNEACGQEIHPSTRHSIRGRRRFPCRSTSWEFAIPIILDYAAQFPWLRFGYTPHFVPWLKANAKHYDAILVHGLWDYVALGSRRALIKSKTPYFVYTHGKCSSYFNKAHPVKAALKKFYGGSAAARFSPMPAMFFHDRRGKPAARHSSGHSAAMAASSPTAPAT